MQLKKELVNWKLYLEKYQECSITEREVKEFENQNKKPDLSSWTKRTKKREGRKDFQKDDD